MRKLLEFVLLCVFSMAIAVLGLEWLVGCGETYVDSQGVSHKNQCIFLGLEK